MTHLLSRALADRAREMKSPGRARYRHVKNFTVLKGSQSNWDLWRIWITLHDPKRHLCQAHSGLFGSLQIRYGSSDWSISVALVPRQQTRFSREDPLDGSLEERPQAYTEYFSYYGGFRYRDGIVLHEVKTLRSHLHTVLRFQKLQQPSHRLIYLFVP